MSTVTTTPLAAGPCIRHGQGVAAGYRLRPPSQLSRGPAGVYLGSESGTSIDFHDYRAYQPGDDLRRVDWGVYARSDQLMLRQYRIEISPVVELVLDTSASMGLYEGKAAAALTLVALLAGAARQCEGRPVLMVDENRVTGPQVEEALGRVTFDQPETTSGGFDPTRWPATVGRPMRILISDFLFPAEMDDLLGAAGRNVAQLVLVQLLAASERDPHLSGGVRFVDVESPGRRRDMRIQRHHVAAYRERLARHIDALAQSARRHRAPLVELTLPDTETDPAKLTPHLLDPLLAAQILEPA